MNRFKSKLIIISLFVFINFHDSYGVITEEQKDAKKTEDSDPTQSNHSIQITTTQDSDPAQSATAPIKKNRYRIKLENAFENERIRKIHKNGPGEREKLTIYVLRRAFGVDVRNLNERQQQLINELKKEKDDKQIRVIKEKLAVVEEYLQILKEALQQIDDLEKKEEELNEETYALKKKRRNKKQQPITKEIEEEIGLLSEAIKKTLKDMDDEKKQTIHKILEKVEDVVGIKDIEREMFAIKNRCENELSEAGWIYYSYNTYLENVFNKYYPGESLFNTWDERKKLFAKICDIDPLSISRVFQQEKVSDYEALIFCDNVMFAHELTDIHTPKQYCDKEEKNQDFFSLACLEGLNEYGYNFEHGLDNYAFKIHKENTKSLITSKEKHLKDYQEYLGLKISSIYIQHGDILCNMNGCDIIGIPNAEQYCNGVEHTVLETKIEMKHNQNKEHKKACLKALKQYGFNSEYGVENYAFMIQNEKQRLLIIDRRSDGSIKKNEKGEEEEEEVKGYKDVLRKSIGLQDSYLDSTTEWTNINNWDKLIDRLTDETAEEEKDRKEKEKEDGEYIATKYQNFLRLQIALNPKKLNDTFKWCMNKKKEFLIGMKIPDFQNPDEYCKEKENNEGCLEALYEYGFNFKTPEANAAFLMRNEQQNIAFGRRTLEKDSMPKEEITLDEIYLKRRKQFHVEGYELLLNMQIESSPKYTNSSKVWCVINNCDSELYDAGFKERYAGWKNLKFVTQIYKNNCDGVEGTLGKEYCKYLSSYSKLNTKDKQKHVIKTNKKILGTHMWCAKQDLKIR